MTNEDTNIRIKADGTIDKDATDVGVPMKPAPEGWTHTGPEDALDPNPKRGDYRERLGSSQHTTGQAQYSGRYDHKPVITTVDQNANADAIVDLGGPLDAADPDYDAKLAARLGKKGQ